MKQIQVSARICIQPGELEEFKKVARSFLEVVIEKEKGQGGTPVGSRTGAVVRKVVALSVSRVSPFVPV